MPGPRYPNEAEDLDGRRRRPNLSVLRAPRNQVDLIILRANQILGPPDNIYSLILLKQPTTDRPEGFTRRRSVAPHWAQEHNKRAK